MSRGINVKNIDFPKWSKIPGVGALNLYLDMSGKGISSIRLLDAEKMCVKKLSNFE